MSDRTPWCVMNMNLGNAFACMRCGQWYEPRWPCPVDLMAAMSKAFCAMHEDCWERPEGEACPHCMRWHEAGACARKR